MNVHWLEQIESDLPTANDWLGPQEMLRLSTMRFPKRRAEWRLGRWTAKRALAAFLRLPSDPESLARIEIRAASSGEPKPLFGGAPLPVSLSLSHRARRALCALVLGNTPLGCDVELIESRGDAFAADYFTAEEQTLVADTTASRRALLLTLLWSAKESALKALHEGLRLDTRSLIVTLDANGEQTRPRTWRPLQVCDTNGWVFHGGWCHDGQLVRTMVVAGPSLSPVPITLSSSIHANYPRSSPAYTMG